MQTTITYNGQTYTESDNQNPEMIDTKCPCGNRLYVPSIAWSLGLVSGCGHCGKDYPEQSHCQAVTEAYLGLIEDGGTINLD